MKPLNPIQKNPHLIESYPRILYIFFIIFLFPMNFPASFGIFLTSKL